MDQRECQKVAAELEYVGSRLNIAIVRKDTPDRFSAGALISSERAEL